MHEMIRRRDATQATLEWFAKRPFDWSSSATCVHLVRKQLRGLGHRPKPVTRFSTPLGAKRALEQQGWKTLSQMMDAILPAITPAEVIMGDIVEMPSDDAVFGALCVAMGNGRVMGYLDGTGGLLTVMQPLETPVAAWRV